MNPSHARADLSEVTFATGFRPWFRRLFVAFLVLGSLAPTGTRIASAELADLWSTPAATARPAATVSVDTNLPDPAFTPVPFWHTNPDGTPVRLNPCHPVSWVFNPAYEPPDGFASVKAAFERMSEETGIRFVYAGQVDEPLWEGRKPANEERYGERWAPILIGWSPPHPASLLTSTETIATTNVSTTADPANPGHEIVVTAQIALNADRLLARTKPGRLSPMEGWGSAVLHELGHVVGLDHSDDPGSLMHYRAAVATDFAYDDKLALGYLGVEAGCLTDPPLPEE